MRGQSGVPRLVAGAGLCNVLSAGHPPASVPLRPDLRTTLRTSRSRRGSVSLRGLSRQQQSEPDWSVVYTDHLTTSVRPLNTPEVRLRKQGSDSSGSDTPQVWHWLAPGGAKRDQYDWLRPKPFRILCELSSRADFNCFFQKQRSMLLLQTEFSGEGRRGTFLWSRLYCRIRTCQGWGQQSRHN